jgi:tetratricopeptide (TPR) repeat protein
LVLACYWPALRGGLVWDDATHVTRPELRSWAGLRRIWFEVTATLQYYPVLHTAFWIEHRLWGEEALGYHLANVLQHAASCCLLVLLLGRLARSNATAPGTPDGFRVVPTEAAWLAALLFGVHPVCVESVAWISEQKNTLSLLFYLLAALAYFDFHSRRRWGSYLLASILFLLSLGTKTVTATLPAAILLVLWWKSGRLRLRRDAGPLLPWFLMALLAGLLTAWVERRIVGAEGVQFNLSAGQRLMLACRATWFYLGKLVWPRNLMFTYPRWNVPAQASGWWIYLAGVVGVTAALWWIRRHTRGALAGWLFFVGSLIPALGFFNVYAFVFSYVADRFQYLACLGIIVPVAVGSTHFLAEAAPRVRNCGRALCAALVLVLAFAAHGRSHAYRDGETLYREILANNPGCWTAHNNLAVELAKSPAGQPEALVHYERAVQLKPDYAEAHNNLAVELAKLPGRALDAITLYNSALQLRPDYAEAHNNLAIELAKLPGRLPEALGQFGLATQLKPDYAEAHYNLGIELAKLPGRLPEALAQLELTVRLAPDFVMAHLGLADVLAKLPSRIQEAVVEYKEALRINPNCLQAHNNLGIAYARQGQLEEARKEWQRAQELNPDFEDARRNLARLQEEQERRHRLRLSP